MRILRVVLLSLIALLALWCGTEAGNDLESHAPIVILSDADFTADNGVRSGAGTVDDPYIISSWRIHAELGGNCLRVENVSSAFRIEHCALVNASGYAVKLVAVERAEIVETCISESLFGVLWESCERCVLRDCSFDRIGWEAVTVLESAGCEVTGCLFGEGAPAIGVQGQSRVNKFVGNVFLSGCRSGIRLDGKGGGNQITLNDFYGMFCVSDSYNRWSDAEGNGNYWSRYGGTDQDGDGVGDTPYRVLGKGIEYDRAPAMVPHHPNAETDWNLCGMKE